MSDFKSKIKEVAEKLFEKSQEKQELQELILKSTPEELKWLIKSLDVEESEEFKAEIKEALLEKARQHKYIRKEGVGPKAKYIYKEGEKKASKEKKESYTSIENSAILRDKFKKQYSDAIKEGDKEAADKAAEKIEYYKSEIRRMSEEESKKEKPKKVASKEHYEKVISQAKMEIEDEKKTDNRKSTLEMLNNIVEYAENKIKEIEPQGKKEAPKELLKHPFKAMTGVTWAKEHVDAYNSEMKKMNQYIESGKKVPEELKNSANKLFKMFSDPSLEPTGKSEAPKSMSSKQWKSVQEKGSSLLKRLSNFNPMDAENLMKESRQFAKKNLGKLIEDADKAIKYYEDNPNAADAKHFKNKYEEYKSIMKKDKGVLGSFAPFEVAQVIRQINAYIDKNDLNKSNDVEITLEKSSELEQGIKHEAEHIKTTKQIIKDAKEGNLKPLKEYQKMIAEDHLEEINDYYSRLEILEKDAKKAGTSIKKSDVVEIIKEVLEKGGDGSGPKKGVGANREKQTDQAKLRLKEARTKVEKKEMTEDEYKSLEKQLAQSLKKGEEVDILEEICKALVKKSENTKDINKLIEEVDDFQKSIDEKNTLTVEKKDTDKLVEELFEKKEGK